MCRGARHGRFVGVIGKVVTVLFVAVLSGLVGVAVVATVTDASPAELLTPADARGRKAPTQAAATVASTAGTLPTTHARAAVEPPARTASDDERYLVRRGETLWGIANRHYENASAGMERIKTRNGLERDMLLAGEVLILPAVDRRSERSEADETCPTNEAAATPGGPLAP
jgi:hypothetical protein